MPDLSIIIPVYNTPISALQRCLNSLDSLSHICHEVVLVDDGSQSQTAEFCRSYAQARPSFRYLPKENGGVSSARNLGLDRAQGRYVMFVDADDMLLGEPITPDCFTQNTDLIIFDMQLWESGSERIWYSLPGGSREVAREELLYHLLTGKSLNSPCVKLFKRSIIEQHRLRFDASFISGEDWLFVCDFSLQAQTAQYIHQPCYRYFRDDATGQSRVAKYPDKILDNQLCRFARKEVVTAREMWASHSKEQILSLAATELIENLFNTATELLLAKVYTSPRKAKLRAAAVHAGTLLLAPTPTKTQLKLFVLKYFPAALLPLAKMRESYLRRH